MKLIFVFDRERIKMENENRNPFMGMVDVGQAELILNRFMRDHPQNARETEELLDTLLEALATAEQLVGDSDDFHNFSVSISRVTSDNQKTLGIVKAGLNIYPQNTDLLADAIKYVYSCGERKECKQWYQTLTQIDKSRWTWRAFSFSIDYLLEEWTSSNQADYSIEDIMRLAKEYQRQIPDEEDAWICEFDIYDSINQKEKGIQVLKDAIEKFRFCPRCWLRYADILMDRGEFEEAEPIIKKMCKNPKSIEKINASYMYFLDGQCKLQKLYNSEAYDNDEVEEKDVRAVYNAFKRALSARGLRESVKSQIDEYVAALSSETGIEFEDE